MRGKVNMLSEDVFKMRITPAYAGKSILLVFQSAVNRDHPRICGEKLIAVCPPFSSLGSPPHMRGKDGFAPFYSVRLGITPAYAGKSEEDSLGEALVWDHPRICGEKLKPTNT